MSGQVVLMTVNEKLSFWRVFEIDESCPISYEKLYSLFLNELELYIQKNKPNSNISIEKIRQQKADLYLLSDIDVNQKKIISNLASSVPLNCEITVKFNPSIFFDSDHSSPSLPKFKFPTVSESEASELVDKADNVYNLSLRTSLKFYQSASKYSLFEYAEALYQQKKWRKLYSLIDVLKEKYPQNTKVSLMIAKCYESLNDNARSFQTYKEALIFSDDPSLLIECSKLYMNSDKYLSSLLLNRSISCDSSNPKVIIRSMIELIANKKYNDVFNITFRSKKSLNFLARLFKKNDELSKNFLIFFTNLNMSESALSNEGSSLASVLYRNGAVFESLYICHHIFSKNSKNEIKSKKSVIDEFDGFFDSSLASHDSQKQGSTHSNLKIVDPLITRIYFTILLNEGLYKRFVDISKIFVTNLLQENDADAFEFLGLRQFFEDYISIIDCKKRKKPNNQNLFGQNHQDGFDLHYITERQSAILDCTCAMSSFLFMIGYCNEIGPFLSIDPNIINVENDIQFWQLRLMFSILQPISETLPALDTSLRSVVLIGDESSIMTSYQYLTIVRPNIDTNDDDDENDENQKNKDKIQDQKDQNSEDYDSMSNSYLLLPNIIIDLSIWMLRKGHKCGQKNSFWSRIETFDDVPLIMIELGSVDCEYEIPRLMRKCRFSTVGKAINAILDIYIQVIHKIRRKLPNATIVIHPVIPTNTLSSPLIFEFNNTLRIKAFENHIQFLDIFSKYGPLDLATTDKSLIKYRSNLRKWLIINADNVL